MQLRLRFLLASLASLCLIAADPVPLTIASPQANPAAVTPLTAPGVPWVAGDHVLIVGDLLVAPGQPEIAVRMLTVLTPIGVTVRSLQNHGIPVDLWRAAALAEIAAHSPRIVVFMTGVGEVMAAGGAKTLPATVDVWRKALVDVTVATQGAGAVMVIASPAIFGDKPTGGIWATDLEAYAAAARAVATDTKSEFCDLRTPLIAALTDRNGKGTRELGVLSKTAGQLKIEGTDIVTTALCQSIAASLTRVPWSVEMTGGPFTGNTTVEIRTPRTKPENLTITYTTDGSIPTDKSRVYGKPFSINTTTQVQVLAVDHSGTKHTAEGWYMATTKRAADAAQVESLPGLWVDHYTLKKWRNPMPPLDSLKPDFETWWPNCEIAAITKVPVHRYPNTNYGLRFTGYFIAPVDGTYVFATNSDDASRVTLGENIVVKNDDLHPVSWAYGAIELTKGYHPLTVLYGQGPGLHVLDFYMSLAGQRLQRVPDALLRRPLVKAARKTITYEQPDDGPDVKPGEPAAPVNRNP